MSQEFEELEVAEFSTGFAANRNLLISNGGMISGSSLVDVKVSTVGGPTERKSLSVGDSLRYDTRDYGVYEIRLLAVQSNTAKFLLSRTK
ncbi:MAG: hypothetical protein MUO29_06700 [Desulfobacterales bacterium]|jgi:hypothetical protein|nr:hypothetical protein [Desulfobacterales bacterium]